MKLKRNSEIERFELIVSQCQDRLFRFAFMRIGDRQTAEDIVQEVLIRLFNAISDGRIIDNQEFFLMKSLSNACIDFHRKKKYPVVSVDDIRESQIIADDDINEEFLRITSLLEGLPDLQAETVRLKCIDGLTFRQISAIQETTESTVKSRYRYALQFIRKKISNI